MRKMYTSGIFAIALSMAGNSCDNGREKSQSEVRENNPDKTRRQLELNLGCELSDMIKANEDRTEFAFVCKNGTTFEYQLKSGPCRRPLWHDSMSLGRDYHSLLDRLVSCGLDTFYFECPDKSAGEFISEDDEAYFKCSTNQVTFVCEEWNACTYERSEHPVNGR